MTIQCTLLCNYEFIISGLKITINKLILNNLRGAICSGETIFKYFIIHPLTYFLSLVYCRIFIYKVSDPSVLLELLPVAAFRG